MCIFLTHFYLFSFFFFFLSFCLYDTLEAIGTATHMNCFKIYVWDNCSIETFPRGMRMRGQQRPLYLASYAKEGTILKLGILMLVIQHASCGMWYAAKQ